MNNVVKTAWADVKANKDFICVKTFSGYRSSQADPQGVEHFLNINVDDETLGLAVLDALSHSRFVLPEKRSDIWIHPDACFDMELYDYKLASQRYDKWVDTVLSQYGYKSKRALFKDMKRCGIESKEGQMIFRPSHHEKLEAWSGKGINEHACVAIPIDSSPTEVGAALCLALSRCT